MVPACESTKPLQKGGVRERHKWEVAIDGCVKLGYLVAMLLAVRSFLVDVEIAKRETTLVIRVKPKSVFEQLCSIKVPEPYRAIPKGNRK